MNILETLATPAAFTAMLIVGAALIALAFALRPRTPLVQAVPVPEAPATTPLPVLSQVGFAEVNGQVVAFRSLVRQSETLDDQQLAAFHRHLGTSRHAA